MEADLPQCMLRAAFSRPQTRAASAVPGRSRTGLSAGCWMRECIHCTMKDKKPQFQHNLHQECDFLHLSMHCRTKEVYRVSV
eukprot:2323755-Rhodomonas_salina.6